MKKMFTTLLLSCFISLSFSQFRYILHDPFSLDIAIGAAIPFEDGLNPGALLSIEPRYAVLEKVIVGARLEATSITPATFINPIANFNASGLLTLDYYFTTGYTRPFVGGGLGAYYLTNGTIKRNGIEEFNPAKTNFGQMLRLGIDFSKLNFLGINHFKIIGEYNFANRNGLDINHNYVGVKVAIYLWGNTFRSCCK